jgi:hypothetical protein
MYIQAVHNVALHMLVLLPVPTGRTHEVHLHINTAHAARKSTYIQQLNIRECRNNLADNHGCTDARCQIPSSSQVQSTNLILY